MPCPYLIVVTNAAIVCPNGLPGSIPTGTGASCCCPHSGQVQLYLSILVTTGLIGGMSIFSYRVYTMLFVIASLIVTLFVIPVALIIWLWQAQFSSKFNWLLNLLMVLVYFLFIFLSGRWDWLSYYLRFLLPIAFVIAASKSFINAKSLPLYPPKTFKNYLELGINAVVMMLFLASLKGYFFTGTPLELSFPLKNGTYYVAHGGNSPTINYHNTHPTQRYALDIMKLNVLGARANEFSPRSLTDYAIFGETLYREHPTFYSIERSKPYVLVYRLRNLPLNRSSSTIILR